MELRAPTPDPDDATADLDRRIDRAIESGDRTEAGRLEAWLWLDGPGSPEGRVTGEPRELLLEMNGTLPARTTAPSAAAEADGSSGIDAWHRLDRVPVPATVACGDLDASFLAGRSRLLAERLPHARRRVLPGVAHLPQLEEPDMVATLITDAVAEG